MQQREAYSGIKKMEQHTARESMLQHKACSGYMKFAAT